MTTVLAAVDATSAAAAVEHAAQKLALSLDATVELLHVREPGDAARERTVGARSVHTVTGTPIERRILDEVGRSDVVAVVVGARHLTASRGPIGHVATGVVLTSPKPVLVAPPSPAAWVAVDGPFRRALVPLEGSVPSSTAVAEMVRNLDAGGADLLCVHVFDAATAPRFWDQPAHAEQSYSAGFRARWAPHHRMVVNLRSGEPVGAIVELAGSGEADVIVLGWSQRFDEGRARIVTGALAAGSIPVLLVPVQAAPSRPS
jgi:nucleotide-binding universal stress UspA family protein